MRGPVLVGLALASTLVAQTRSDPTIQFELHIFNGLVDVTRQTRVAIHRAGERGEPLVSVPGGTARIDVPLAAGLYDVQATHVENREVRKIRWALRLVVMPYPDEHGHHLEVINFQTGFGGLEVIAANGTLPPTGLYPPGVRDKPLPPVVTAADHILFVIPAGSYDLRTGGAPAETWKLALEVPLDRTRVWVLR